MSKSTKEAKAPRTIKVKTVLIAIAVTVALFASFVAGWTLRSADQARVTAEASVLVSTLKSQK